MKLIQILKMTKNLFSLSRLNFVVAFVPLNRILKIRYSCLQINSCAQTYDRLFRKVNR
jgi:hypothetical protein